MPRLRFDPFICFFWCVNVLCAPSCVVLGRVVRLLACCAPGFRSSVPFFFTLIRFSGTSHHRHKTGTSTHHHLLVSRKAVRDQKRAWLLVRMCSMRLVVAAAGGAASAANSTVGLDLSTPARLQRARATGTAAEHEKKLCVIIDG